MLPILYRVEKWKYVGEIGVKRLGHSTRSISVHDFSGSIQYLVVLIGARRGVNDDRVRASYSGVPYTPITDGPVHYLPLISSSLAIGVSMYTGRVIGR